MALAKGIRKSGKNYMVYIDLPPRDGYKEKTYAFHLGTVESLSEAKEIRQKAEQIREECKDCLWFGDTDDCLYFLNKLKESIKNRRVTRKDAACILEDMLYEHQCNSCFVDFSSTDDREIEHAEDWIQKEKALKLAIKALKGK